MVNGNSSAVPPPVMMRMRMLLLLMMLVMTASLVFDARGVVAEESHYLNEWAVEVHGGLERALSVARRHGFELVNQLPHIDDHYIMRHDEVEDRSKRSADDHSRRLEDDSEVKWAEQQRTLIRAKRKMFDDLRERDATINSTSPSPSSTNTTAPSPSPTNTTPSVRSTETPSAKGNYYFNDPKFPKQWYLFSDKKGDMRLSSVQLAWKKGFSGKGVVVSVVDDGLEYNHSDIAPNYDPYASLDLNSNDSDPFPRYDPTNENKHGTRCAGEIAMVANNSICGAGIAFNAKIGGIRLLDGNVTDLSESLALCHNISHIDIYSLSWGPTDDGKTLDKPHRLAQKCMDKAIKEGRGGKGVIYVLASGNGGRVDNCNCDGYAASRYTNSISSVTMSNTQPWYGELCPSSIATTPSSGNGRGEMSVVSTDLHNQCTLHHSGTSASAPLGAGIIALALEANSNLTWRDVQHLIIITADPDDLNHTAGWYKNAAGFCVNLAFGFGLMDAGEMVTRAKTWKPLPPVHKCEQKTKRTRDVFPREFKSGGKAEVSIRTDGCAGSDNEVNFLEHVEFVFSANYTSRGALGAVAISPAGTKVELLKSRTGDNATQNFTQWPLMSVHTWGEDPNGVWTFIVEDKGLQGKNNSGELLGVTMILYGTKDAPFYRQDNSTACRMNMTAYQENMKVLEEQRKEARKHCGYNDFYFDDLYHDLPCRDPNHHHHHRNKGAKLQDQLLTQLQLNSMQGHSKRDSPDDA